MSKLKVMESLQGELVSLEVNNRTEDDYSGELLDINDNGDVVLKYSDHGREFISYFGRESIVAIHHKVLSV